MKILKSLLFFNVFISLFVLGWAVYTDFSILIYGSNLFLDYAFMVLLSVNVYISIRGIEKLDKKMKQ